MTLTFNHSECGAITATKVQVNRFIYIASTGAEVTNFRSIQYYTKTTIAR